MERSGKCQEHIGTGLWTAAVQSNRSADGARNAREYWRSFTPSPPPAHEHPDLLRGRDKGERALSTSPVPSSASKQAFRAAGSTIRRLLRRFSRACFGVSIAVPNARVL